MLSKNKKKLYIEEMKGFFKKNSSVFVTRYQGLTVKQIDELRKEMRKHGILFKITKNRITKLALEGSKFKKLENYFTGATAVALSDDAIMSAKILTKFAKKNIISGNRKNGTAFLLGTLILALLFVLFQFQGFAAIVNEGYYFTGSESTITTSFIYVLVLTHLAHLAAGLIVLLVLIYNHFKQRYYKGQTLGLELGATFWHFLDVLWVYLFFFLYFFR